MNEKKIYTLDDIAKEMGVSKTTVSRAISGKGRIGKETRERIQQFIKEHEYQPNVVARGLAQRKTYNIGLVMPLDYADTEFPFFKDCMNGIYQVASKCKYDVLISLCDGEDLTPVKRLVINRKVDGIILSRAMENNIIRDYLVDNQMPHIVIGPSEREEIFHIDNDNEGASFELTKFYFHLKRKKIALLGGKKSHSVTKSRYRGFARAYEEAGKSVDEAIYLADITSQKDVEAAMQILEKQGIDGIICMDDVITNMLVKYINEKNIPIPEAYIIASLYDSKSLENTFPSITSVHFDTEKLGENACVKLLALLNEEAADKTNQLEYQIILRQSTDC